MTKPIQTKEEAIETVKNGNKSYYLKCLGFAREWVSIQFKPFTSEDLRKAYFDLTKEEPRTPSVYGAVFNTLNKESRILHYDYVAAKNKQAHGRILRRWISTEYSNKQRENASRKESTLNLFDNENNG